MNRFNLNQEIFEQLLNFQRCIVKKPYDTNITITAKYDFFDYFNNLLDGKEATLIKKDVEAEICARPFENWEMYAKKVVWYGRKDSSCTYIRQAQLKLSKNNG